ncbi:MAG TPA: arsenic transporter [Bradyrhizobium sp.]
MPTDAATWAIAILATLGVLVRPWNLPEFIWAVAGAALLVLLQLLPWPDALAAAGKGTDVYFFLIGMMLLAEVARKEGLFDWLAAQAVRYSHGDAKRLFLIVYVVGTAVTVLLSNDATAVVLTPAVYAATRAAKVEPLPYLLICAFIANAASFVLPISNPANLVVFGHDMPPLADWLRLFALPSLAAIVATYFALRLTQRRALDAPVAEVGDVSPLTFAGKLAASGIVMTAVVLLAASALGSALGLPTFVAGAAVTMLVLVLGRQSPWPILQDISWSVLPLVAGLFILVEGLNRTGVLPALAAVLKRAAAASPQVTAWLAGLAVAIASNVVNNLPVGLIAATIRQTAQVPTEVAGAVLIGVDLGPNLSVTGSLATILWLIALRREGEHVGGLRFLRLGLVVMPPALLLSLLVLSAMSR